MSFRQLTLTTHTRPTRWLPPDHIVKRNWFQNAMCTTQNSTQHVTAQAEMHIFENSVPDFKICAQCFNLSLNYFDIILYYFPSEQKFNEFSSTFSRNSSFQGLFKHPWNLKLNSRAFQGLQGVALSLNEQTEATQHWSWLKAENDFTQLYKAHCVLQREGDIEFII